MAARFVEVIDPTATLQGPTLESILAILKGQINTKDLQEVIKTISAESKNNQEAFDDCKDVLLAL